MNHVSFTEIISIMGEDAKMRTRKIYVDHVVTVAQSWDHDDVVDITLVNGGVVSVWHDLDEVIDRIDRALAE